MKRQYFSTGFTADKIMDACITKTETSVILTVTDYYGKKIIKSRFQTVKEAKDLLNRVSSNWWTTKGYVTD